MDIVNPRKAGRTYQTVATSILSMVVDGSLQPGDWLLPERALAESFQVSRATVREALKALELLGVVEVRRGEGTSIKKAAPRSMSRPLSIFLLTENASLADVYEVRMIVETEAAELAAERHTPEDLVTMKAALVDMQRAAAAGTPLDEADFHFHRELLEATHNRVLPRIMEPIADLAKEGLSLVHDKLYRAPGLPDQVCREHAAIYAAIEGRDGPLARRCMADHFALLDYQVLKSEPVNARAVARSESTY